MFLQNAWYVAGWATEIPQEGLLARRLLSQRIVFYRKANGEPAALEDKCCHRFAPLSHGRHEGDCVRCMYHGLKFDGTGRCVEVPGQDKIGPSLKVRSYPVIERDGFVWIWMGEPEKADPEEIHDAHWQNDPKWHSYIGGYIHYASNFQLIVDNLLDFSHLAYVHGQSIGSAEFAQRRPEVERGTSRLKIMFSIPDIARPPYLGDFSSLPERVDRSNHYEWYVKGNFFAQDSVVSPAGTGDRDSMAPETARIRTIIALTPEDENNTHYFWSITHNDFQSLRSDVTTALATAVSAAFDEDRAIIDAQQQVVAESGETGMASIAADGALFQVRGMLLNLLKAESQTATDTA